ncbi:MAG TPA: nucleoside-diphosphate sugar epimerase/dehydratase [Bryobacteraceae bacterium]|jgi:FlaA1/EpsC-like NDP-sugar epimerase|nr:nucleoside-diphosphate sugar epimerase/dehydratase [Bryobacteraceae bacterium]
MSLAKLRAIAQRLFPKNSVYIACFQGGLIFCSLCVAWLLRFDFSLPYLSVLLAAAPVLVLIRLAAMAFFNLHHGWWRYTSLRDVSDLLKAIGLGSVLFLIIVRFLLRDTDFPRSIYLLEALTTTIFLAGIRTLPRLLTESVRTSGGARRVIVIGAGMAAQAVIREIGRSSKRYCVIGCVDDNRSKRGIKVHGVPVIGTIDQLPSLVAAHAINELLIAIPSASGVQMQRIVKLCEKSAVKFKTVPGLQDIIDEKISISHFREVRLEDLLGRDPVTIDLESVKNRIDGRVVLVTGAAGTIGSELCRQILQYDPRQLLCVDQSETGIFYLQMELSQRENRSEVVVFVADIGDRERMRGFMLEYCPEIVFHAAAYKHVPIMEVNVYGAVKNNIFGLLTLLDLAEDAGCQSLVLISTDKAVNPSSVMGVTKRVCELIIAARPNRSMRCVSVRFGNVLGSNGSVVPVLQKQLRNNQHLTITHPEISRYFMTTREAVSLVLQAFAIGAHGDTLVLDMGTPVRILDLARTLIGLSGKTEKEVPIKFTGLRDGEKLYEELFYPHEELQPTSSLKIRRVRGAQNRWLELLRHLELLQSTMTVNDSIGIREKLREIVPQYSYSLPESQAPKMRPASQFAPEPVLPSAPPAAALGKAAGVA